MSERIRLDSGEQIRDWASKNGFDVVSFDSDAPRFFQPGSRPVPAPWSCSILNTPIWARPAIQWCR